MQLISYVYLRRSVYAGFSMCKTFYVYVIVPLHLDSKVRVYTAGPQSAANVTLVNSYIKKPIAPYSLLSQYCSLQFPFDSSRTVHSKRSGLAVLFLVMLKLHSEQACRSSTYKT